jgi:hypothetical protein
VFSSVEDGAFQAIGVAAMHGILRGADHHEEDVVDIVHAVVVDEHDEHDVDVDLKALLLKMLLSRWADVLFVTGGEEFPVRCSLVLCQVHVL